MSATPLPTTYNPDGTINVQGAGGPQAYTDRSGTITLGGTAQTLMAANPSRKGFLFQNLSNEDMWINDLGGTAAAGQPNIWVPAGTEMESPSFGPSVGAFSIFAATTGSAFVCREC